MSSLNEEQLSYVRSLSAIPADRKCWCGWWELGKCQNCPAGKSLAQRMAVSCPFCRNFPSADGSQPIRHVITCPRKAGEE